MTNSDPRRPFGRLATAMVTPMRADGSLDLDGAARLAEFLVDVQGNDALVISGTTGESATTTDAEKEAVLRAVVDAVGSRAVVVAGVGTADTHHSVELAKSAEKAGAHGLLVVTPYYNRPPQPGLLRHFTTIADSTGLPMMLYDIPMRTATEISTETLRRLAEHERIVAVKDAKGDFGATSWVTRDTGLAIYSGDDRSTMPAMAVGAVGVVGVVTHLFGRETLAMIDAFDRGDHAEALRLHHLMLPVFYGFFRTQGAIMVKAALNACGLPSGPMRAPMVDATAEELALLRGDCAAAGLELGIDVFGPSDGAPAVMPA
jgi:4-hydroxy-tetrahydrodipicolinate synthase